MYVCCVTETQQYEPARQPRQPGQDWADSRDMNTFIEISDLLRSGLSLHQTVHHTSLVVWSRHRPLTEPAQFGELHASPPGHQVGGQLRVVG